MSHDGYHDISGTTRVASEGGFALLLVLWTVVLLSLLFSQLVASSRSEATLAGDLRLSAGLEAAADGAIYETIFRLIDNDTNRWTASGVHRVTIGHTVVDVRIENLAGRVNPNTAPLNLLAALMQDGGVERATADRIAAAVLDWRTPGHSARPNGAKDAEYRSAGRDYVPPDAPFQDVGELRNVLEMTPEILTLLEPHLSVYAPDEPDALAADPAVSRALRKVEYATADESAFGLTAFIVASVGGPADSRFERQAIVSTKEASPDRPFFLPIWRQAPP